MKESRENMIHPEGMDQQLQSKRAEVVEKKIRELFANPAILHEENCHISKQAAKVGKYRRGCELN